MSQQADALASAHQTLFSKGLEMRNKVVGKAYVDKALAAGSSDYARPMQEYVTEACWGSIWGRPGLELKTRSLLNLAMLCALNRSTELGVHTRGALSNGASEVEIRETILQAACYCGMPAGVEGFKVTERVINEWKAEHGITGPVLGNSKKAGHETPVADVDVGERMNLENI
ncbi:protocatechuate 3,4-dioxygenase, P3,4O [Elsinoe ampelina]|uniref:Protocatechuate 3,4-dioxygenase, P3,4O n=1 Tax=Elsinoe ampelina TaxID=302913 RepID=A0A6A6GHV4_9PEZI|nr:protocatechuate 3,4-dioxygenase, P3,4O [Elsinoe ampelina]